MTRSLKVKSKQLAEISKKKTKATKIKSFDFQNVKSTTVPVKGKKPTWNQDFLL